MTVLSRHACLVWATLALCAPAGWGEAATVWSEAVDGDLTDFSQPGGTTDIGFLPPNGTYRVSGSLDGGTSFTGDPLNVADPFDQFAFDVQSDFSVSFASLGGGVQLRLRRREPFMNGFAFVGIPPFDVTDGIDVFAAAGTLNPGTYSIQVAHVTPGFVGDPSYAIDIATGAPVIVIPPGGGGGGGGGGLVPVPGPAGLPLLVGALGVLGLMRRRG